MNTVLEASHALLWNRSSGWSDSDGIRHKLESILSSGGARVEVKQVERGMNIQEESKAIVGSGANVLIAAGGDGTINAAASALIHQPTALGVIPAGTLNHFARDLEIPLEPEKAAQMLLEGRIIRVDAAAVNGRVFINNSVLGLFPNYRVAREAWERHGFGSTRVGRFVATVAAVLEIFWRLPHLTVSLKSKGVGARCELRLFSSVITNTAWKDSLLASELDWMRALCGSMSCGPVAGGNCCG